jgi:SAM-dependent methyltransferase
MAQSRVEKVNGDAKHPQAKGWVSFTIVGVLAIAVVAVCLSGHGNILSGFSEHNSLGPLGMQLAMSSFCLTGTYLSLQKENKIGDDHMDPTKRGEVINFSKTGEVPEDDYNKQSIYSLLYAGYRNAGVVLDTNNRPYRFTFNTWGVSNPNDKPFGPEYPQRHGMAAYHSLATMPAVAEYVNKHPHAHFLEIGCGTGAGADLISRIVHPTIQYTALDMQKAAIETCIKLHAAHDNPHLTCMHANGKTLPIADNSVDVVVVSETHIAEMEIGEEEKAIFAEMKRVMKPGGLFIWGNALPTKVWGDGTRYLQENGFGTCGSTNITDRAILARDEDVGRVNSFLKQLLDAYPIFSAPIVGTPCRDTIEILIKNFYRHPGTDLYQRMEVGADSYMNLCHQLK